MLWWIAWIWGDISQMRKFESNNKKRLSKFKPLWILMKTTTVVGLKGAMFYHGRFLHLVHANNWRSILKINFVFMNLLSNWESESGSPKLDKEHTSSSEIYFAQLQRKVRVKIWKVRTDCSLFISCLQNGYCFSSIKVLNEKFYV